jgi:hypothetical protein
MYRSIIGSKPSGRVGFHRITATRYGSGFFASPNVMTKLPTTSFPALPYGTRNFSDAPIANAISF